MDIIPKLEGKHLVTSDAYFYAKNGVQYNAVYGNVEIVSDEILGIKTNSRSANWFAKVGTKDNYVVIAGCQIHYALKCDRPNFNEVDEFRISDSGIVHFKKPCGILDLDLDDPDPVDPDYPF